MSEHTSSSETIVATGISEIVKELRRQRRWRNIWRILFAIIIISLYASAFAPRSKTNFNHRQPHTALINVYGEIMPSAQASADHIVASLERAFKDPHTKGIILRINSPGGSAVQASYVYNAIQRLREQHKETKIYAVCSDMCASAAYYIASAADAIYANPMSVVGSIGVLHNGFGFVDTMKKLGIKRRMMTAGANKASLDPFSPMTPKAKQRLQAILDDVHQQFINDVKQGRGKRLQGKVDLFNGDTWTGHQAKPLGLIDDFGSAGDVARQVIKEEKALDYTTHRNYLEQLANRFGASMVKQGLQSLQSQSLQGLIS